MPTLSPSLLSLSLFLLLSLSSSLSLFLSVVFSLSSFLCSLRYLRNLAQNARASSPFLCVCSFCPLLSRSVLPLFSLSLSLFILSSLSLSFPLQCWSRTRALQTRGWFNVTEVHVSKRE
ncbi:hypothetical protein NQD34_009216 [Periophthalmus magnuspinnatus]|nr:hypothetical protein NQD34_009216 [Periophthalmus magnuspinnatus]